MIKYNMYSFFIVVVCGVAVTSAERIHRVEKRSETCLLPPYPEHGTYKIAGDSSAKPGDDPKSAFLNVTCSKGYGVIGNNFVICVNGDWSTQMPQCVRFCHLPPHRSVEYHCINSGSKETRPCNEFEPTGTTVKPECKSLNYYHSGNLPVMRCLDGDWDNVVVCSPVCGTISESKDIMVGGKKVTALPWHADIFKKYQNTYKNICGGSIISSTIVVTAAHCFWESPSKKIMASDFAVMVGKTHHGWDVNEQKYLVNDIKIPMRFQGMLANFQDDIALVMLSSSLVYSPLVRPVCVDFDLTFERKQLRKGNIGKLAVWSDPKDESYSLQILELPYIPIDECIHKAPEHFKEFITSDKICAGCVNGTVLCRGNSGTGISFPEEERGVTRYYLRGITSTSPSSPNMQGLCEPADVIAFTQVNKHEHLFKQYFDL